MEFADKLNRLIGTEDQAKVAHLAKIAPTTFSAYCTGKTKPSADAAVRLAISHHQHQPAALLYRRHTPSEASQRLGQ
jgi:plasmid maintenance system antidote protein VapI